MGPRLFQNKTEPFPSLGTPASIEVQGYCAPKIHLHQTGKRENGPWKSHLEFSHLFLKILKWNCDRLNYSIPGKLLQSRPKLFPCICLAPCTITVFLLWWQFHWIARFFFALFIKMCFSRTVPDESICDPDHNGDPNLVVLRLENNYIDSKKISPTAFSCVHASSSVILKPQKTKWITFIKNKIIQRKKKYWKNVFFLIVEQKVVCYCNSSENNRNDSSHVTGNQTVRP